MSAIIQAINFFFVFDSKIHLHDVIRTNLKKSKTYLLLQKREKQNFEVYKSLVEQISEEWLLRIFDNWFCSGNISKKLISTAKNELKHTLNSPIKIFTPPPNGKISKIRISNF